MKIARYPGAYENGKVITGLENFNANSKDEFVFHAGTTASDGVVKTNGGRVLNITSVRFMIFLLLLIIVAC